MWLLQWTEKSHQSHAKVDWAPWMMHLRACVWCKQIQALQTEIHHNRLLVHWNNESWRIRFNVRGGENRRYACCVLKNGNWNIQDILLAQFLLHESRMGLIAKHAQRSMLIIPRHLASIRTQSWIFIISPARSLCRRDQGNARRLCVDWTLKVQMTNRDIFPSKDK
jgi:hypothetical protein